MTITRRLARARALAALGLVLCVAMAAGCGSDDSAGSDSSGSQSEEARIMQVFDDWQASFIAGDGDAVCSRLTSSGKQEILGQRQSQPGLGPDASCEDVIRAIVKQSNEGGVEQQPSKAISVKIDGDKAVAQVRDGGRPPQPVRFVKEDGEWKLPSAGFGSSAGGS